MNTSNILQELEKSITSSITSKIYIADIMNFFWGDRIDYIYEDSNNSRDSVHASTLSKLYNGNINLPFSLQKCLVNSTDWSLKRLWCCLVRVDEEHNLRKKLELDEELIFKNVEELYKKYNPTVDITPSFSNMVKELLWKYFFNKSSPDPLFVPYTQKCCKDYIKPQKKTGELKKKLSSNNLIFITGYPATGKKQLIKNHIELSKISPFDVAWISSSINSSLEESFKKARIFLTNDNFELVNDEKLNLLSQKCSSSLLVLDVPYITPKDLAFIDHSIVPTKIKCIVITRTLTLDNTRVKINMDNTPVEVLKKIFRKSCSDDIFTSKEFEQLCSITSHNPLAISLVGKMLALSKDKTVRNELKLSLLNPQTWIWNVANQPKLHDPYKSSTKAPDVYVESILYRMLPLCDKATCKKISNVALWYKYGFPFKYLYMICEEDDNLIDTLIQLSLLQFIDSEKQMLAMPALIADIFLNKYPITFSDCEEKLRYIIFSLSPEQTAEMDFDMIYSTLYNVLYYLHINTVKLKSRPTSSDLKLFADWNRFLLDVISYFSNLGNITMANALSNDLYMAHNYKNKYFFKSTAPLQNLIKKAVKLNLDIVIEQDKSMILNKIDSLISNLKVSRFKDYNDPYLVMQISLLYEDAIERAICSEYAYTADLLTNNQALTPIRKQIHDIIYQIECSNPLFQPLYTDYKQMIVYYIHSQYDRKNTSSLNFKNAEALFRKIIENKSASSEFKLRAKLHRFHYTVVCFFICVICDRKIDIVERYIYFDFLFQDIIKDYVEKIHYWRIRELYLSAVKLYISFKEFVISTHEPPSFRVDLDKLYDIYNTALQNIKDQTILPNECEKLPFKPIYSTEKSPDF